MERKHQRPGDMLSAGQLAHLRQAFLVGLLLTSELVAHPSASFAQAGAAPSTAAPQSTAPAMLDRARQQLALGQPSQALLLLDTLSSPDPEIRAESARLRAECLYREGRFAEAEQALTPALAHHPTDADLLRLRGFALYRLHRAAEAAAALASAGPPAAWTTEQGYVLMLCYIDTRQYDQARRALASLYALPPEGAEAYLLSARMLFRHEVLPIAESFALKALALNPTLPLAHELLGEIALAGEHLPQAEQHFQAEQKINPLAGEVYDRLGDTYLRSNQPAMAQHVLRQAMVLEPTSTAPYILLGKALLKQGQPEQAITYLRRARLMDEHNFMTHALLSQAYRAEGRSAEAAAELATAQAIQQEVDTSASGSATTQPQ